MTNFVTYFLLLCIAVIFIQVPLGFFQMVRVIGILKNKHQSIWQDLGGPTIISTSIKATNRLIAFILQRKYLEIGDDVLSANCGRARLMLFIQFVALPLSFVLMVLIWTSEN
jgi:hypothetical protein